MQIDAVERDDLGAALARGVDLANTLDPNAVVGCGEARVAVAPAWGAQGAFIAISFIDFTAVAATA